MTIDIFIAAYMRAGYTINTIRYLIERTKYPYRLFLFDNGGNSYLRDRVEYYIGISKNIGLAPLWNMALALTESEYFVTTDNDIYAPNLDPDWLTQLVGFMDNDPKWGAISLHPHVFIGAAGIDPNDSEDVKERNMCGGVLRIMRTKAVKEVGGWNGGLNLGRGAEERDICGKLQNAGYKTGITSRIRAYHPFGKDVENNSGWGYEDITPEEQGHNPALKDEVLRFDNPDAYDSDTFLPK